MLRNKIIPAKRLHLVLTVSLTTCGMMHKSLAALTSSFRSKNVFIKSCKWHTSKTYHGSGTLTTDVNRHFTKFQGPDSGTETIIDAEELTQAIRNDQEIKHFFDLTNRFCVASSVVNQILTGTSSNHVNQLQNDDNTFMLRRIAPKYGSDLMEFKEQTKDVLQRKELGANYFERVFAPMFGNTTINLNEVKDPSKQFIANKIPTQQKKLKMNFKVAVAYFGPSFCGWQRQKDAVKPSVEQTIVDILTPIFASESDSIRRRRGEIPPPIDVRTSGRTDSGVHALSQICRVKSTHSSIFYTGEWRDEFGETSDVSCIMAARIQDTINSNQKLPQKIRCLWVEPVDSTFHPSWLATCRGYAYLIDLNPSTDALVKPRHVVLLNVMLQQLEGIEIDYLATSYGRVVTETTLSTMYWARASLLQLSQTCMTSGDQIPRLALCIELIGNRFLRRMVRILVSTALRAVIMADHNYYYSNGNPKWDSSNVDKCLLEAETYYSNEFLEFHKNDLLNLILTLKRDQTAPPAPPGGLMFVGAEFGEM